MPDVELIGMDVVASELRNHASGLGYVVVERVLNRSQNLRVARADLTVQGLGCFLDQGQAAPSISDLAKAAARWVRDQVITALGEADTATFKVTLWAPKGLGVWCARRVSVTRSPRSQEAAPSASRRDEPAPEKPSPEPGRLRRFVESPAFIAQLHEPFRPAFAAVRRQQQAEREAIAAQERTDQQRRAVIEGLIRRRQEIAAVVVVAGALGANPSDIAIVAARHFAQDFDEALASLPPDPSRPGDVLLAAMGRGQMTERMLTHVLASPPRK